MQIRYYREQGVEGSEPSLRDFNSAYAEEEFLKYLLRDYISQDDMLPYENIPDYLKETFIKNDKSAEFKTLLQTALTALEDKKMGELSVSKLDTKGKEILDEIKENYPQIKLSELKGSVRKRLLEEPEDMDASFDVKKLTQEEGNEYLESFKKRGITFKDEKKSANEIEYTVVLDELEAHSDAFNLDKDELELDTEESVENLSKFSNNKIAKIFSLGFNSIKLASKSKETDKKKVSPQSYNYIKTGPYFSAEKPKGKIDPRNRLVKTAIAKTTTVEAYDSLMHQSVVVEGLLLETLSYIKYLDLFDSIADRAEQGTDALYQFSEDIVKEWENYDSLFDFFQEIITSLSDNAKKEFGKEGGLLEDLSDFNEIVAEGKGTTADLDAMRKVINRAVKQTKENKDAKISEENIKRAKKLSEELKGFLATKDLEPLKDFEFKGRRKVEYTEESEGKKTKKTKYINTVIPFSEIFKKPELVSNSTHKEKINEMTKELEDKRKELKETREQLKIGPNKELNKKLNNLQKELKFLSKKMINYEKRTMQAYNVLLESGYITDEDEFTEKFRDEFEKEYLKYLKDMKKDILESFKDNMKIFKEAANRKIESDGEEVIEDLVSATTEEMKTILSVFEDRKGGTSPKLMIKTTAGLLKKLKAVHKKIVGERKKTEKKIKDYIKDFVDNVPEDLREQYASASQKDKLTNAKAEEFALAIKEKNKDKIIELVKKSAFKEYFKKLNLLNKFTITVSVKNDSVYTFKIYRVELIRELENRLIPSGTGGSSEEAKFKPYQRRKVGTTKFRAARKGDYANFLDSITVGFKRLNRTMGRLR